MDSKRSSIINKIRALHAKTVANGCTEAEAIAAMETAQRLMESYQIDAMDVRETVREAPEYGHEDFRMDRRLADGVHWMSSAISKLTGTMVYYNEGDKSALRFFGEPQDVALAMYFMQICERGMEGEWFLYSFTSATNDRQAAIAFKRGCAVRLTQRLEEMKADRDRRFSAIGGGALMIVTKDVRVKRALEDQMGVTLNRGRADHRGRSDSNAYEAGKRAADRIGLNPGLSSGGQGRAQIGGRALLA